MLDALFIGGFLHSFRFLKICINNDRSGGWVVFVFGPVRFVPENGVLL